MRTKQATVCRTCRSHKLGCDGKRPACSQCLFLGRSCEGYQLDAVFVPFQPTPQKRGPRKKTRQFSAPEKISHTTTTPQSETGSNGLRHVHIPKTWRCPSPSPVNPPTAGELAAVILNCFTPANTFVPSSPDTSTIQVCGAWVGVLPRLVNEMPSGSLISAAVKTFGTAILDRGPDGRCMKFRSLEAYNTTLQRLRHSLVTQSVSFDVKTATAMACLAMTELISPTSTEAFYTHFTGIGVLFQFYPPELFSSDVYHTIFVGCRPILVGSTMPESFVRRQRKPTFLAQDQWKRKPFCFYPPSDLQLFINDTAILPSLLEAIDSLSSLPTERAISRARRTRLGLLELYNSLCEWKNLNEVDTMSLLFPSIMAANINTHALSFEIICLTEMEKADVFLFRHGSTLRLTAAQTVDINYSDEKLYGLAHKICQNVEYFLQDEMKLFGPASAVFPLRIAHGVFSRDHERNREGIKRCQAFIDLIHERGISAVPYISTRVVEKNSTENSVM